MQDRIPVNPGRVLISPENGSAYYATMTRADNATQGGTPLNKNNLLRDATASLFGLGADAVLDDVFSWIGQYNTHWWSVLHGQAGVGYSEVKSDVDKNIVVFERATREYYYSDRVEIDQSTGAVNLVNPKTITLTYFGSSSEIIANCERLKGKYVKNFMKYPDKTDISSVVFYVDPSATIYYANDGGTIYQIVIYGNGTGLYEGQAKIVTSQAYNIPAGAITYEHSTDRNAYPDSGTVDGLTYQYLGIPFENAVTAPRIATGSYTGTGTYGASNPNSLTFDFVPKLVICYLRGRGLVPYSEYFNGAFVWLPTVASIKSGSNKSSVFTQNGNTLTWYTEYGHGDYQFNGSGNTYDYIAIG